ncbi:MAG: beta-eliminating lyase-related protein, partial [Acidobacteriota bacterium]
MNFGSDNVHGVHDAILDAIRDANSGTSRSYGHDDWSARAEARLRDVFQCDLSAYLVVTGTAANSLALAACCPPHGAVVCHQEAHINVDECG